MLSIKTFKKFLAISGDQVIGFDVSGEDETYDLLHLAPGEYRLVAEASGYEAKSRDGVIPPELKKKYSFTLCLFR